MIMNELPELPRQIKAREADFGIVFRTWFENNPFLGVSFELKHSRGKDYLNFSEVKDEQIMYALRVSTVGVLTRVQGLNGEADYVFVKGPAYIVIKYPRCFCIISIEAFIKEKKESVRKSLTWERACKISFVCV
jgi:hypothetical protein